MKEKDYFAENILPRLYSEMGELGSAEKSSFRRDFNKLYKIPGVDKLPKTSIWKLFDLCTAC